MGWCVSALLFGYYIVASENGGCDAGVLIASSLFAIASALNSIANKLDKK